MNNPEENEARRKRKLEYDRKFSREYFKNRYNNDPEFKARKLEENKEYRKNHPEPKIPKVKCLECDVLVFVSNKSGLCQTHSRRIRHRRHYYKNLERTRARGRENARVFKAKRKLQAPIQAAVQPNG